MKEIYATAHYTNPQGQTFHGTPAVYSVTIPKRARNQEGAEAFVRYLLSEPGQEALLRRGFPRSEVLVGGDETTVPQSLRTLIQGVLTYHRGLCAVCPVFLLCSFRYRSRAQYA